MAAPIPQSAKMTALQNLQKQLPVASEKLAKGMQAARDIQLQQAVARAPTGAAVAPTAQQTAAAATAQTGEQQIGQAQQMVQQAGQIGQLQLGEQQMAAQQKIAGAQQAARQQEMTNVERLGRLDLAAKKELYDKQLEFQKDEAGRTLFNQRQLADYALQNAQSDEQFKDWAQKAEQLNKRNLQALEASYALIIEDLNYRWQLAEQANDQRTKVEIQKMKAAAEEAMRRKQAKAANMTSMWGAIGTVGGAVVGGFVAGPQGAIVGAQMGGAAGSTYGSQQG